MIKYPKVNKDLRNNIPSPANPSALFRATPYLFISIHLQECPEQPISCLPLLFTYSNVDVSPVSGEKQIN